MIKIQNLTKIYPGTEIPAVNNLNLEIGEGETCVLVGPSGCGKTTTLKMINKLILPTDGEIYIADENVLETDPIELRRNIGYVIQEIGLFPHMTIFENIATVPNELNWPKEKIKNRVYELMELMDLDPEIYKGRRPSDLSGGQRQRVGVARAMAANPPVMLMDEPFGAVDPITRGRLQDEFLNLQEKLKKTIIFVTHDINEALKMGTKIAVMRDGKLVQYTTPDGLLAQPENEFVEDLIGGDSTLKRLHLVLAEEVMKEPLYKACDTDSISDLKENVGEKPGSKIYVTDNENNLKGYLPHAQLKRKGRVSSLMQPVKAKIADYTRLSEALSEMLSVGDSCICVIDDDNKFKGVITLQDILDAAKSDNEVQS